MTNNTLGKAKELLVGRISPINPEPELASGEVQDSDQIIRARGYAAILILFLGSILLASVVPIESAARAPGLVEVEGKRKTLQHLEGGIVSEILVQDGDKVSVGDPLIRLDTTQSRAELRRVEGRFWTKQALVDRLTSERNDESDVFFSNTLLNVDDPRAVIALENERTLFSARKADRTGELELIDQRKNQYEQQLIGLTRVVDSKKEVATSIEAEIEDLNTLLREGYVDKQRIRQLTRTLAETLGEISDLDARIDVAQISIAEANLQATQLEKRFKTEVTRELTLAHDQLFDIKQLHDAILDRVVRSEITAPVSGVVLDVQPNVLGAVVRPGQELLSIVPDGNKLIISAKLPPMDIDRVRIGQAAEIRFSVFKGAYTISGVLTKISADSLSEPQSNQSYYAAKILLSETDMALLEGRELVPGMPVEVLIKTGTTTVMGYLTSPLRRAFSNAMIED